MRIFLWLILVGLNVTAGAAVKGETIEYQANGTKLKGYLAFDTAVSGKRPGVLVVHEWWGHNEYARKRARMLAALGYTALAIDMYGEGKQAEHPQQAGELAASVNNNMALAQQRFAAATTVLRKHTTTNDKIAAIGYCFGGGIVLNMARMGMQLNGVVSFHGSLETSSPAKKNAVKAKLLILNGTADSFTTKEQISAFSQEMQAAGAKFKIIHYHGAKHSFTNPDADKWAKKFKMPLAYHAKADKASWQAMQNFFKEIFN